MTTSITTTLPSVVSRIPEAPILSRDREGAVATVCACLILLLSPLLAQAGSDQAKSAEGVISDYPVGPGDVLTVTVADSPELSGKVRVTDGGLITLAGVASPIPAGGLSVREISRNIAAELKREELLRDPVVNVFAEEYHNRTVTVLGAVNKPSVYPLEKQTTLLESLSLAGGLRQAAGGTLTIQHKDQGERVNKVDLGKLMSGAEPRLNLDVHPGDVLTVAEAPVVYVVGAVAKPGGFAQPDPGSSMSVLNAVAMAEGLKPIAAAGRSLIIRRAAEGRERQEIPIDVGKLMSGKIPDQLLEANDILFIPESGMKKSLHKMGEVAVQGVNGIAIYGVGYRVAGLK